MATRATSGDGAGIGTATGTSASLGGYTRHDERLRTETKASFKTTEFFVYLAILAGILIAGLMVDDAGDGGFGATKVWLYATILTVGYMVSRGLAKSGSSDPYFDGGSNSSRDR